MASAAARFQIASLNLLNNLPACTGKTAEMAHNLSKMIGENCYDCGRLLSVGCRSSKNGKRHFCGGEEE